MQLRRATIGDIDGGTAVLSRESRVRSRGSLRAKAAEASLDSKVKGRARIPDSLNAMIDAGQA
jgi:hypothetical protein